MKRLGILCLGPPAVLVDGHAPPSDLQWRKHVALLAYLALSPGRARTRDHLVGLLWPEKSSEQAHHSLNEALRRLRACLGAGRLVSDGDVLRLAAERLDVDAWRFDAAESAAPDRAVALLRGDFLEGLALEDAPALEEWASGERTRYRSRAVVALVAHGERCLAESRWTGALDAGRRALLVEPFSEPAARLAMRAAALSGDAAGALSVYHEFAARLEAQLGEQPSRELGALAERIRGGRWLRVAPGATADEPPLIGRAAQHREAFGLLAAGLSAGPLTLMITGDPGMGRSRLLNECVDRLRLEGARAVHARFLEGVSDEPWSGLRQLMRGLLDAPGLAATDPEALGVLAGLVPQLAERVAPRSARDTGQVAAAFAAALAAVADEQPLGLAVDDFHHADPATVAALDAAVAELGKLPVVLVLTAEEATDTSCRALLRLRGGIGDRLPGLALRLTPFTDAEVRELVVAMAQWCEGERRDRLARRIVYESGGSPFLAVTLLRALHEKSSLRAELAEWPPAQSTLSAPLPISIPHLTRMAIIVRFSDLDETDRALLVAASVPGVVWDLELVSAMTRVAVPDIEARLVGLERRHFVVFDGERYAFAAPLLAEVLRTECLTRGRIRALRNEAIAHLQSRSDLDSRVLRLELTAANDPSAAMCEEAVAVARAAMAAGSRRAAARAIAAGRRAHPLAGDAAGAALEECASQLEK